MLWVIERGYHDIGFFARFWFGIELHPGQIAWCENRAHEKYLVTGRRWGKSLAAAVLFLWRMFYQPHSVHLNCSITMDQARLVLDKAKSLADASPRGKALLVDYVRSPFPILKLRNGAELWARSTQRGGEFIRGHSFHSANYDEIAFGARSDLEVIWPCLIDYAGPFSGTTTPKGQNWLFFEVQRVQDLRNQETARLQLPRGWEGQDLCDYFFRVGPSTENPNLPKDELRRMIARLPDNAYRQEILGEFVPTENTLFTVDDLQRVPAGIRNDDLLLPPEQGGNELVADGDAVYVSGWDLGRKKSWAVGIVLRIDVRPWRAVSITRLHRTDWPDILDAYQEQLVRWRSRPLVDNTGVGDPFVRFAARRRLPADPFQFSGKSKQMLLEGLQQTVQDRDIEIPGPSTGKDEFDPDRTTGQEWQPLIDQMLLYTWDEAEKDENETFDDLMALALAVEQAKRHPAHGRTIKAAGRRDMTLVGGAGIGRSRLHEAARKRFKGW